MCCSVAWTPFRSSAPPWVILTDPDSLQAVLLRVHELVGRALASVQKDRQ
jgi:hypothetical protein